MILLHGTLLHLLLCMASLDHKDELWRMCGDTRRPNGAKKLLHPLRALIQSASMQRTASSSAGNTGYVCGYKPAAMDSGI